jgi:penicillin-binding protein 1A
MVRAEMLQRHGATALTDGYTVTTTLDSRLQAAANAAAWRAILEYDRRHGYRGALEKLDAAALEDPAALNAAFARHRRQATCSLQ